MHERLLMFLNQAIEAFDLQGPVYRFGFCPSEVPDSRAMSEYFPGMAYIDLGCGEPDKTALPLPNGIARTVVCFGVLEQVADPSPVLREILRILAPSGAIVLGSTLEVASPGGAWLRQRLQPDRVSRYLAGMEGTLVGWEGADEGPHSVYAIGFKSPVPPAVGDGLTQFLAAFRRKGRRVSANFWRRALAALGNLAGAELEDEDPTPFVVDLPAGLVRRTAVPKPHIMGKTGNRLDLMQ